MNCKRCNRKLNAYNMLGGVWVMDLKGNIKYAICKKKTCLAYKRSNVGVAPYKNGRYQLVLDGSNKGAK